MLNFCTLFDSNYLSRGLAMYDSLIQHCPDANLFIICLDDTLFDFLKKRNFPNLTPISIKEVEFNYKELASAKQNRTYVEYIFTLSPVIPLFLLEKFPDIEMITSMDADIFFFSDPSVLFNDSIFFSIAITPHQFKNNLKFLEKYGKYNVSFQTFKNDKTGIACLKDWKNKCIDWCYDKYEDNKFADQKYLDEWFEKFSQIKEYSDGSGVAPWNIEDKDISTNKKGDVLIKDKPLIYYHFHGLRNTSANMLSLALTEYGVRERTKIVRFIYLEYIKKLLKYNEIEGFPKNQIKRGMHPLLGKLFFLIFIGDLYYYKNNQLIRIYNLNFFRTIYSNFKKKH